MLRSILARPRASTTVFLCVLLAFFIDASSGSAAEAWHRQAEARLAAALARAEALVEAGGWPPMPAGPTLDPGTSDPRVPALRRRLQAEGEVAVPVGDPRLYDAALAMAVRDFQARHGLLVDGRVGRKTRAALNVPARARAATLRLNLERLRAFRPGGPSYVLVNIPGFEARLLRRAALVLKTPVIVGLPDWPTPRVEGLITRIVVNPTWTVPRKIMIRETIPSVRRDPDYLVRNNMRVFAGWSRRAPELDPATIDWESSRVRGYRIRQDPGPGNALGRVKFLFDNPHDVYLHDTPTKKLFERPVRAFSHGCIRVGKPLELAQMLLEGQRGWDADALDAAIAGGDNTKVWLQRPLPVHVVYWTAWVDEEGRVQFRPDIYGHDRPDGREPGEPGSCGPIS